MQKKMVLFFCIWLLSNSFASELRKPIMMYGVPCLYAKYPLYGYINRVLPHCYKATESQPALQEPQSYQHINVVHVSTPQFPYADLGQDHCIKL